MIIWVVVYHQEDSSHHVLKAFRSESEALEYADVPHKIHPSYRASFTTDAIDQMVSEIELED